MKSLLLACIITLASSQLVGADTAVTIRVGEPAFYGRIDVGGFPHPELIFPQPLVIRPVVGVVRPPIYLRVPPGHAKDWRNHCHHYNACGERVFFVHDHWYKDIYAPHYRERHGNGGQGHEKGHGKDRD